MSMYGRKTRCPDCKSNVFADTVNNIIICNCGIRYVFKLRSTMIMKEWIDAFFNPIEDEEKGEKYDKK